jgi:hypothetical protein
MPRHRARGRSPHREGAPYARERLREGQGPTEEARDDALLECAQDAVRIAAEVVDIALVAAAVAMRELVVRLNGRDGASGASSSDHR